MEMVSLSYIPLERQDMPECKLNGISKCLWDPFPLLSQFTDKERREEFEEVLWKIICGLQNRHSSWTPFPMLSRFVTSSDNTLFRAG